MTTTTSEYRKVAYDDIRQYREPKESFKMLVDLIKSDYDRPFSMVDVGCAAGAFINYAKQELTGTSYTSREVGADVAYEVDEKDHNTRYSMTN